VDFLLFTDAKVATAAEDFFFAVGVWSVAKFGADTLMLFEFKGLKNQGEIFQLKHH
jgi:hypothetical protein